MANLNRVEIIGRVTREPEVKFTPKGTAVTDLGLAVSRWIPGQDDERSREETTFLDVTIWGKDAERAGDRAAKGTEVFIEGRLQLDSWEDKQTGQKRTKLKIVCEKFQLLGVKGSGAPRSSGRSDAPPRSQGTSRPRPEPEDDDIPF